MIKILTRHVPTRMWQLYMINSRQSRVEIEMLLNVTFRSSLHKDGMCGIEWLFAMYEVLSRLKRELSKTPRHKETFPCSHGTPTGLMSISRGKKFTC